MTLGKRLFSLFSDLTTVSESPPEASLASNPAGIADSKFRYSHPNSPFRHPSAVRSSSERPIRPHHESGVKSAIVRPLQKGGVMKIKTTVKAGGVTFTD